jgi:predicted  nucleic acid-binding Zn-ribbon protein
MSKKQQSKSKAPSIVSEISNELEAARADMSKEKEEMEELKSAFSSLIKESDQLRAQLANDKVVPAQVPQAQNLLQSVGQTISQFLPIVGPLLSLL